uniref:ATPbinding Cassette (ABC) Superfamily putative n=1 Tax=Albugo laibachii Nc14 TaxID=890382 RepID=F0W2U3_9STRA|nr:ATPbinding Cassette (ABC) Superfamily putative [Albugo laibachii Nc14]|eukprot:CCA15379.1 ATPbinding Cassette (ABC) Superfamily putative [Albugo laibachii Nc14]
MSAERFWKVMAQEAMRNKARPSLFRLLFSLHGWEVGKFALWSALNKIIGLMSPILLKLFLEWADASQQDGLFSMARGYNLAGLMIARSILAAITSTQYSLSWQRFELRVRAGLSTAIHRKTIEMRDRQSTSIGHITSLVSVDLNRISGLASGLFDIVLIPVEIIVALFLLRHAVSYAFVSGLVLIASMFPIQTFLGKKNQNFMKLLLHFRDKRLTLVTEIVQSVRTIKLLGWLPHFLRSHDDSRTLELGALKARKYIDAICVFFWASTPAIVQTCVFAAVIFTGNNLTAANAFTAMALLDRLIFPINYFPWIINGLLEARISALRIQKFLFYQDSEKFSLPVQAEAFGQNLTNPINVITDGSCFSWHPRRDNEEAEASDKLLSAEHSNPNSFQLVVPRLRLRSGTIYLVQGRVGSGKSSFLHAILGEMALVEGFMHRVDKPVAYAPQRPWLFQGSIRENITLSPDNEQIDQTFYNSVLTACDLITDIKDMKYFDRTQIGECGRRLSGGQRLRLGLGRAMYARSRILLLDDPISALDPITASKIVSRCFSSSGNSDVKLIDPMATVVVVTQQLHLWKSIAERSDWKIRILMMDHGKVVESISFDEFWKKSVDSEIDQSKESQRNTCHSELVNEAVQVETKELSNGSNADEDLEETRIVGAVASSVWIQYVKSMGRWTLLCIFVAVIVMQSSQNGLDYWIACYVDAHKTISPLTFAYTLIGITVVNSSAVLFRSFLFAFGGIQAATKSYNGLSNRVFHAPLCFFTYEPAGRIVNRLNRDTYNIDDSLPFTFNIFIREVVELAGALVILMYENAVVVLVLVPLSAMYFKLQQAYRPISRHLKRLDAVTQSPILETFNTTLSGIAVIRSMRLESKYIAMYTGILERSQKIVFLSSNASGWFGIRLDSLGVCITSFVAIYAVVNFELTRHVNTSILGLTLTYTLPIVGKLNAVLNSFIDTERQLISVERVNEYRDLPPESANEKSDQSSQGEALSDKWPEDGSISVKELSVVHHPWRVQAGERHEGMLVNPSDLVLQNVSCELRGGARIGICGRTGAGKSSFFNAFFREVPWVSGNIEIDGIDLMELPLDTLRRRLTYIPQEVTLFSGTVRRNLDPGDQFETHELWSVLKKCLLDDVVSSLGGLSADVLPGTFSQGESQLLCIARALLRQSKVVFLDESTSLIDPTTEHFIIKMLENVFKDATLLMIAHRLESIRDCDIILVFDNGQLIEGGHPKLLLEDSSSALHSLAQT